MTNMSCDKLQPLFISLLRYELVMIKTTSIGITQHLLPRRNNMIITSVHLQSLSANKQIYVLIRKSTGPIVNTLQKRHLSSSSSGTYTVNIPSKPTTTWERSAKLVKNTDSTNNYLEDIRAVHDPAQHIKTIEDELKGTIGKALGNQGQKVLAALRLMKNEKDNYDLLFETFNVKNDHESLIKIRESALRYNDLRKSAEKARWELIVHRQAVGFIVNNHKIVHEKFPIGEPLPVPGINGDAAIKEAEAESNKNKKQFGDQLDWWEKIGRWR